MRMMSNYNGTNQPQKPAWWSVGFSKLFAPIFGDNGSQEVENNKSVGISTSPNLEMDYSASSMLPTQWRVYEDRKSIYRDIVRMDAEDEWISTALDIIADAAVDFRQADNSDRTVSFEVRTEDEKIKEVLEGLTERLKLHDELWQIIRDMVKHGNYLPEVLIDRKRNLIVSLKPTVSYQIWPNTATTGEKIPGWSYIPDHTVQTSSTVQLQEWQICPFIFGAKRGGCIATPMLASARRNWSRLAKIEDGMAVARLTRAYDKLVHKIPADPQWTQERTLATVKQYINNITRKRIVNSDGSLTQTDSPMSETTDFYLLDFGDNKGGIQPLTSTNQQLGNLNDVYYLREKLIARLRVPSSFLQITSAQKTHLKSGAVGDVDIQFASFMRGVLSATRAGLRRLFDLELMLNGIVPDINSYSIAMAEIRSRDPLEEAKVELTNAQAATYFVEAFGTLPPKLIADKFLTLTPEQQATLKPFLAKYGDQITDAKVKAIKLTGEKPPVAGSSPISKAGKSKAQRPNPENQALIDVDKFVEAMVALQASTGASLDEGDEEQQLLSREEIISLVNNAKA